MSTTQKTESEREEKLLQERTRKFAENLGDELNKGHHMVPLLSFFIGSERYGVLVDLVSEVKNAGQLTTVPGTKREIAGLINIREEVRPVLYLNRILGVPDVEGESSVIFSKNFIGFLVQSVEKVDFYDEATFDTSLNEKNQTLGKYIKGIIPKTMTIIDFEKIISDLHGIENNKNERSL